MLSNYIPPYDATVINRLVHRSGAILMGKTNLDEFAMGVGTVDSFYGPCINPWNSDLPFIALDENGQVIHSNQDNKLENDWYLSGGSSGGSAVAVAVGTCFASLASDTGGSTRNPASHVGIFGFKPSYGLISRYGLIPLTHSLDVVSIMARSVEDVRLVFNLIRGHDINDSTSVDIKLEEPSKEINFHDLIIGIPKEYQCPGMSSETLELWKSLSDQLSNLGAKVKEVSLPHTGFSTYCYSVINCCEVASNFSCYDGIQYGYRVENLKNSNFEEMVTATRSVGFGNVVKGRIFAGNFFLLKENVEEYYYKALKVRRRITQDFDNVFKGNQKVDILLTPVTLTQAPLYSEWSQRKEMDQSSVEDYCTQPANMAGLPAISIPCRLSPKGLPMSLQLIGPRFSDLFILSIASKIENLVKFPKLVYNEK